VGFLSELQYLNERERFVVTACEMRFDGDIVRADITGYTGEFPAKEIKAVTFHDLFIQKVKDEYSATVVFDV